jgi:hypothetical protein
MPLLEGIRRKRIEKTKTKKVVVRGTVEKAQRWTRGMRVERRSLISRPSIGVRSGHRTVYEGSYKSIVASGWMRH